MQGRIQLTIDRRGETGTFGILAWGPALRSEPRTPNQRDAYRASKHQFNRGNINSRHYRLTVSIPILVICGCLPSQVMLLTSRRTQHERDNSYALIRPHPEALGVGGDFPLDGSVFLLIFK